MITSRQVRAARALLGWKQQTLADHAVVALTALKRLEADRPLPVRDQTREKVQRTLEEHGVSFLNPSGGVGVLLMPSGNPGPGSGRSSR